MTSLSNMQNGSNPLVAGGKSWLAGSNPLVACGKPHADAFGLRLAGSNPLAAGGKPHAEECVAFV